MVTEKETRQMKALVVDDDLITRIVLQEILSGYAEVHSCVDGQEAVLAYRRALARGRRCNDWCSNADRRCEPGRSGYWWLTGFATDSSAKCCRSEEHTSELQSLR